MSKQVKCPSCGKKNNKEETIKIQTRYYCLDCGEKKKKKTELNLDGWDELYKYICNLYDIDKPTGMMFKQIKEFRTEYGYTNKGIYLTLKYYYETLGHEIKENTGLGIVIYYYEQAKQHFIATLEVKRHAEKFEPNEKINMIKIKIKDEKKYNIKNQLSLNDIIWEEDVDD